MLIVYFLGNICAKNFRNRTVRVKIIASQRWDVFETRCSLNVCFVSSFGKQHRVFKSKDAISGFPVSQGSEEPLDR